MRKLIVLPGRSVYHEQNCRYLKHSKKANWRYLDIRKAEPRGCRPCKYCCTVRFHLLGERKVLKRLTAGTCMEYKVRGDVMYVKTDISCWKILYEPKTLRYRIYHRNHSEKPIDFRHPELEQYHFQGDKQDAASMLACFRYIQSHDAFRKAEQERGETLHEENVSPRYRAKRRNWNRRKARRRLDALFAALEKEHPEYVELSRW